MFYMPKFKISDDGKKKLRSAVTDDKYTRIKKRIFKICKILLFILFILLLIILVIKLTIKTLNINSPFDYVNKNFYKVNLNDNQITIGVKETHYDTIIPDTIYLISNSDYVSYRENPLLDGPYLNWNKTETFSLDVIKYHCNQEINDYNYEDVCIDIKEIKSNFKISITVFDTKESVYEGELLDNYSVYMQNANKYLITLTENVKKDINTIYIWVNAK